MPSRKKTPQILGEESPEPAPQSPPTRKRRTRRSPKKPSGQASSAPHAPQSAPSPARLRLSVTAPEQLAQAIRSSFSQALEEFSDIQLVDLVDAEADWTIVVLGVEIRTTGQAANGVALSATIVQALSASDSGTQAPLSPEGLFHDAWLRIGASTDLERLCSQIAANFHDRYIAVFRAQSQQDHPNSE